MNSSTRPVWAISVGVIGLLMWFVYISVWDLWLIRPIPDLGWITSSSLFGSETTLFAVAFVAGTIGLICLALIYVVLIKKANMPEVYQLFKRLIPVLMIAIAIMGAIAHPDYYTDSDFRMELTIYQERQLMRATGDVVGLAVDSIGDVEVVDPVSAEDLVDLPESNSSSDSDSDMGAEFWGMVALAVAVFYYVFVLILAAVWSHFWLVAWFVYALGAIGVGVLDLADGEEL